MTTYTALAAFDDDEPTVDDLAALVAEEPVVSAEVAVVDAECRLATSPDEVAVKAHRNAVTALNTVLRTRAGRATTTAPAYAPGSPLSTARRVVIRPATRTA
ncbi:DUF6284 family protein [Promicromonospora sp. NPDC057488]|uniref:DUF6284 family protein n=1 Tax=Promicromonospora sp. NPDC057488 TaxID=3346147 RepID=UPI00366C5359